jgi:opacity protein-like surface antigen
MSGTTQPRALLLRCFLAGTSLIVLTGSTLAADLPVRKAPPPAVMASWAGFYLGAHGGYGWKRDDFSEPATVFFSTTPQTINGIRSKGAVYGGQAGYNWQFGPVVTGLEIDFSVADIKGSHGVSDSIVEPGVRIGVGQHHAR